jgi:hypothetical protein
MINIKEVLERMRAVANNSEHGLGTASLVVYKDGSGHIRLDGTVEESSRFWNEIQLEEVLTSYEMEDE